MPRKQTIKPDCDLLVSASEAGDKAVRQMEEIDEMSQVNGADRSSKSSKRSGSWREIEARRERAALKASLADVWDDDFDLDDEILAEMDHTAGYFTPQAEIDEESFEEVEEIDEFFDEEDV